MEKLIGKRSPVSKKGVIWSIINYFVGYNFVYPIIAILLSMAIFDFEGIAPIFSWIIYIGMLAITLQALFPYIRESWDNFIKRLGANLVSVIGYTIMLLVVSIVTSAFVSNIVGPDQSINQQGVELMTKSEPWQMFFAIVIFAPVVEELLFRGCFYRSLSSKISLRNAAIISALLFGMIHILEGILTLNLRDMSYILVYGSMGLLFVKVYDDTQSIIPCILVHSLYNAVSFLMMMLL